MEEKYPLAQWLEDELSDREASESIEAAELETYNKIKKYSSSLKTSDFDDREVLSAILKSKKKTEPKVVSLSRSWIYKVAAILVITFGIGFFYLNSGSEKQIAAIGTKTAFLLPDQSEVVLNAGSEIIYSKSNWDRNVNLEGEAYFKVAKGKRFEVQTNLGKVAVLGTQFDVKARENRLDVTCFEGRVQVNYKKFQTVLTQGQSVTFENNKQINQIVSISKPEWLHNKIAFDKENLLQVIAELERNYDVKIKANLFQTSELFTGKIPSDNLDVALNTIATTYQLKIIKTDSKSIIFEKK